MHSQKLHSFSNPIKKEIKILKEMGLKEEEIKYLVWLRLKDQRSLRWH